MGGPEQSEEFIKLSNLCDLHRWEVSKSPGGEIHELKDDYASIKWLERLQLSKSYKQEAHKFSSKIAW